MRFEQILKYGPEFNMRLIFNGHLCSQSPDDDAGLRDAGLRDAGLMLNGPRW
jgi:hypothetical protein